jgi:iron(III) transport system permease protein
MKHLIFFRGRYSLLAGVWLVLGAYVAFPAIRTFLSSCFEQGNFTWEFYREFFIGSLGGTGISSGLQALWGSVSVSLASVVLACLLGVPLAFLVERNDFPGRRALASLAFLPLTLPPIVGVVSFDLIFSEAGILPRCLAWALNLESAPFYLSGRTAVVVIHAYSFFPFFFLLVSNALRGMDASLLEASRGMGMGWSQTLLRIEMPMLTPALYGASVMVFMASMASFSAPLLFDIQGLYLSTRIYNLKTQDLWGEAYATTTVFTLASLGMLLLLRFLRGTRRYQSVGKGVPRRRRRIQSLPSRLALGLLAWGILLVLLLPHLGILLWSLTEDGTWTYQLLPPQFTFENYSRIFGLTGGSNDILRPVINSFWMAGAATLANIFFGIAAAYVLKGRGQWRKSLTDLLVMLPWALPGTVIAINLIVTFSHPTPLALGASLANSVWLLPMAYFIRNIPLVVRPIAAAWERFGDDLEEAARSLGSGRLRTMRTVAIPLVFPAMVGGGLLAFVTALGEFIASVVLFTPANKPISLAVFGEFQSGAYGLCSAYGVLLIVLIAAVMIVGGRDIERTI